MPFEPEQDERKISEYLDLPKGREVIWIDTATSTLIDEDGHPLTVGQGYRIVQLGVLDTGGAESPDAPRMMFGDADGPLRVYQLWLIQCYRRGFPLAAERRWHPRHGIRDAIIGLEDQTATREDVLAAWRGHALIMTHLRSDPWPRSASQDAFIRERGRRLAAYCTDRDISDPTRLDRQAVADGIGYASVEALRNGCHTKGVTPDQIKAEAYHQLRAETR